MFFFSDVLLRCMYGNLDGDFIFSDFAYGDRRFSEFRFFQSWGSSCIDIDIDDVRCSVVVVIHSILFVP